MENREYYNQLFDIYKELLTSVEKMSFESYYKEDYSLSEIAENRHISKSSVGKTIKQTIEKLIEYERILKLFALRKDLTSLLDENSLEEIKSKLKNILEK